MSNIFVNNNRFNALLNDSDEPKPNNKKRTNASPDIINQTNSFKTSSFKQDNNNAFSTNRRHREDKNRIEIEKEQKKYMELENRKKQEEALKPINFPELSSNITKPVKHETTICFLEKVKTTVVKKEQTDKKVVIKPGWGCSTKDPQSNRIIYNYGESTYFEKELQPIDALNAMVNVYEQNIKYYDSLWGEGAYNEKYKFPNHDYEYFEKLDEEYEDEIAAELEENDSYFSDYEY